MSENVYYYWLLLTITDYHGLLMTIDDLTDYRRYTIRMLCGVLAPPRQPKGRSKAIVILSFLFAILEPLYWYVQYDESFNIGHSQTVPEKAKQS